MITPEEFTDFIEDKGMSVTQAGKEMGISKDQIYRWRSGKRKMGRDNMKKIELLVNGFVAEPQNKMEELRQIREDMGLSLKDAADAIGINDSLLHKYEIGKSYPGKRNMAKIDAFLGELPETEPFVEIPGTIYICGLYVPK